MLCMTQSIIVGGHNIEKISFDNFEFGAVEAEHCTSRSPAKREKQSWQRLKAVSKCKIVEDDIFWGARGLC